MGSGGKAAAGNVAAASIYTGGRITTNVLSWAKTATIAFAQIALTKWMIKKQEKMAEDKEDRQIACVEHAIDQFLLEVNENILPDYDAAYPDVPRAARYVPVSVQGETWQQMIDNITNHDKIEAYLIAANRSHQANYLVRVAFLSPGFVQNIARVADSITNLLTRKLSPGDAVEITGGVAERAAFNGRIGGTRIKTASTLGITGLRMDEAGRDALMKHTEMLQRISPVESEVLSRDLVLDPKTRVQFALEQAQLMQADLQNAYNQAALKPPVRLARIQTKLQMAQAVLTLDANKANMVSDFIPNFPALFAPAIKTVAEGIQNSWQIKDAPDSPHLGGNLTPSSVSTVI